MKLLTLLISGFCFLSAMDLTEEEHISNRFTEYKNVTPLEYVHRFETEDRKECFLYKNKIYNPTETIFWDFGTETSISLTIKHIGKVEEKLFITKPQESKFVHVVDEPKYPEDWNGFLWEKKETLSKGLYNHRFQSQATNFTFNGIVQRVSGYCNEYRIYQVYYTLDLIHLLKFNPITNLSETINSKVVSCNFQDTGIEVCRKKSGLAYTNKDFSGQGSNGEMPKNPHEIIQRVREYFPAYKNDPYFSKL